MHESKPTPIRLRRMVLDHFKCHDHLELTFPARGALLVGDNGIGKTSVYDALTWLLFGKDSLGNDEGSVPIKPLAAHGGVKDHQAITSVEAELEVDGAPLVLKRTLREVWTGKGAVFGGNTSGYFWDGSPLRKSAFEAKVNALLPEPAFRLLTAVHRFAGEIPWQERRAILLEMAGCPPEEEILAAREDFAQLFRDRGRLTLEEYRRKLLAARKQLTQTQDDLPPRLDECSRQLAHLPPEDFSAALAREEALLTRIRGLESVSRDPGEALSREERRQQLLLEQRSSLERQLRQGEQELERCRREQVPEEDLSPGRCPVCGQPLPEDPAQFHRRRQNRLDQLARREREITGRLQELEQMRETLEPELSRLEGRIRELRRQTRELSPEEEQLPRLRRELEQCRRILAQEGTRQRLLERVEQLRRQQRDAARELAETERKLTALEAFYRYQAGFLESRVNSLFRMASFRLFREKVEGGLEERCDLVYRGVPWTGLNSAAKVNLGIDVINSLSRFYGFTAPLFIDNAESVTSLEDTDAQVIRLAVRPGEAALRLEGGDHGS